MANMFWIFTGIDTPVMNLLCKASPASLGSAFLPLALPRRAAAANVILCLIRPPIQFVSFLCNVCFTWRSHTTSPEQVNDFLLGWLATTQGPANWHMMVPENEVAWIFPNGWITERSQFDLYKWNPFSKIRHRNLVNLNRASYNLPITSNRMIKRKTNPSYLLRTFY